MPKKMKSTGARRTDMSMLRPDELSRRIRECPVVYVPSGIYEWHDAQNPMGTDALKAAEICRRAAAKTGGLVHMPSYIGAGGLHGPFGSLKHGALNFSDALVRSYLAELFAQLEQMGFELIVLLYGHTSTENINAHERAAVDYMRRKDARASVLCVNDVEPAVRHRYKVADHAAKWETSFMLAAHPDAVRMDRIPAGHGKWWGLDPRKHASAAEGERMYGLVASELAKLVGAARAASRQQLIDGPFPRTRKCWKNCRNIRDLREDYWGGDERWEDPFCFFCIWRSPGLAKALAEIKGSGWVRKRIKLWDGLSKGYTGRCRRAWKEIRTEMEPPGNGRDRARPSCAEAHARSRGVRVLSRLAFQAGY